MRKVCAISGKNKLSPAHRQGKEQLMEEKLHKEEPNIIRNHKDTVFRMLYRDESKLLELYNALNDTHYQDADSLKVYTLENAIYLSMKNDVSFLLGPELNLYEHQASFNPNMPLRDLLYIARQLEKYIKDETLYSTVLTKIPVPRFVVFYNGTQKHPEIRKSRPHSYSSRTCGIPLYQKRNSC